MEPRLETLKEMKLIGMHLSMSLLNNRTSDLWGSFSPRIQEIKNRPTMDRISLQKYNASYFTQFDPAGSFEKWAAVEVSSLELIPSGMQPLIIPGGLYAVFDYKGSSEDPGIFQYIYRSWIPNSCYQIAQRPHFEVLGEKYRNNDPNSEEEIWIPIESIQSIKSTS